MTAEDSYFTEARRADPRAMQYEPHRYHLIHEHSGTKFEGGRWRRYEVEGHGDRADWFATPTEAREDVDRCIGGDVWPGCTVGETIEKDPFARFER